MKHKLNCSSSSNELAFTKLNEVCTWRWNNIPKVKAEELKRLGPSQMHYDPPRGPPNLAAGLFFCSVNCTMFPIDLTLSETNPSTLQPCLMALHHLIVLLAILSLGVQAISWCMYFTFHLKTQYLHFVFYAFLVCHFRHTLESQWISLISPYPVKEI